MKNENGSMLFLLIVIVILLVVLFSMISDIFSVSAQSPEILPTTAPIETCFNHGMTVYEGCGLLYFPIIMNGE